MQAISCYHESMKAVKADKYGDPDVLVVKNVPRPKIKPNQVLVRVYRTPVTATDINFQTGQPAIVRLFSGLTRPKGIAGDAFAGKIEGVGAKVAKFKVGDRVFGSLSPSTGTHAEFAVVKESGIIARIPKPKSYDEAAANIDGPLTANAFLQKVTKLKKGDSILINGASGSVGIAAVQLAKHIGAEVTGVCSTKNVKFVKKLGADNVIDYKKQDFTKSKRKYDYVFDTVNKSTYSKCRAILNPKGIYLTTGPHLDILPSFFRSRLHGQKAIMAATGPFWKQREVEKIAKLMEKDVFKAVIDKKYKIEDVSKAFGYVGSGHKVGSVLLKIQ